MIRKKQFVNFTLTKSGIKRSVRLNDVSVEKLIELARVLSKTTASIWELIEREVEFLKKRE